MRALDQSRPVVLDDPEPGCRAGLCTKSKNNMDLSCSPFSRPVVLISSKERACVDYDKDFL